MNNVKVAQKLVRLAKTLSAASVNRTWEPLGRRMAYVDWGVILGKGTSFDEVSRSMESLTSLSDRQIRTFEKRGELLQRGSKSVSGAGKNILLNVQVVLKWPEGTSDDEIESEMKMSRFRRK